MTFWIIIGVTGAAVAAIIARAMLRRREAAVPQAQYDLNIYRDQLREVERDLARGVLEPGEAQRLRTEVSRRILAADAQVQRQGQARPEAGGGARLTAAIAAVVTVAALTGGAWLMYAQLGAPGYRDLPMAARLARSEALRADRMDQAEAEAAAAGLPSTALPDAGADFLALMDKLRARVAERPDDLEGLELLARNEAALGNSEAAYAAQARILELKGDAASATDHAFYADLLISAAHGYVSTEAEAALREALARDPAQPMARYYQAQYLLQVDRPDAAFRVLEALLRDSPPDAPWVPALRTQIEDVAWRAGVNVDQPAPMAAPGPDEAAIAAAQDMEAEDRQAMIEGMVAQLSDRLATQGGSAQDWARLIRALAVLERFDRAREVYAEAQQVFAGRAEDLALLREAAKGIGAEE